MATKKKNEYEYEASDYGPNQYAPEIDLSKKYANQDTFDAFRKAEDSYSAYKTRLDYVRDSGTLYGSDDGYGSDYNPSRSGSYSASHYGGNTVNQNTIGLANPQNPTNDPTKPGFYTNTVFDKTVDNFNANGTFDPTYRKGDDYEAYTRKLADAGIKGRAAVIEAKTGRKLGTAKAFTQATLARDNAFNDYIDVAENPQAIDTTDRRADIERQIQEAMDSGNYDLLDSLYAQRDEIIADSMSNDYEAVNDAREEYLDAKKVVDAEENSSAAVESNNESKPLKNVFLGGLNAIAGEGTFGGELYTLAGSAINSLGGNVDVNTNPVTKAYEKSQEEQKAAGATDLWKLIKGIDTQAYDAFMSNISGLGTSVLSGLGGAINKIGGNIDLESNPIANWNRRNVETQRQDQKYYAENVKASKAAQFINKYGTQVWSQAPSALLGIMLSAIEIPVAATSAGLEYLSSLNSSKGIEKLSTIAGEAVTKMAKDPQFWYSVSQEGGSAYNEAIEDGASPEIASVFSSLYGIFSAMIEVGGVEKGIEDLPKKVRNAIESHNPTRAAWEYLSSIKSEILEEEQQGMLENLLKGLYTDRPIYSDNKYTLNSDLSVTENDGAGPKDNAVINPVEMGETAIDTAITTAALGAGEAAIVKGINAVTKGRSYDAESYAKMIMAGREQQAKDQTAKQNEEARKSTTDQFYERKGLSSYSGNVSTKNITAEYNGDQVQFSGLALDENGETKAKLTDESGSTKTVDISDVQLPDGTKEFVEILSAGLGDNAAGAYRLYNESQDAGQYIAAMDEAINLYAANGVNLDERVEQERQRSSNETGREDASASLLTTLTPAQLSFAQARGNAIYQQKTEAAKTKSAQYTAWKDAEKTADRAANGAENISHLETAYTNYDAAVTAQKQVYADAKAQYDEIVQELSGMERGTEEYGNLLKIANELADQSSQINKEGLKLAEKRDAAKAKLDAAREAAKPVRRKKGTVSYGGEGTLSDGTELKAVDKTKLTRVQKNVVAMIETLADAVNIDYVIFDGDAEGKQGAYQAGGKIYVNINAGLAMKDANNMPTPKALAAETLSHEMTHFMQEYAPEEYQQLKDFVVKNIGSDVFEKQVRKRVSEGLSYDEAVDEVVANSCTKMLRDSKAITKLARENMTLAEKIADVIDNIVQKISAAFEDSDSLNTPYYAEARDMQEYFGEMQKLWDDGLIAATENYNVSQGMKIAATEDGIKFQKLDDSARIYLDYSDAEATEEAFDTKVNDLINRGKIIRITSDEVNSQANAGTWSDVKSARKYIKQLLQSNFGTDSVSFSKDGNVIEAYFTKEGRNHTAAGENDAVKAAALNRFREIVDDSEYVYSAMHDVHSNAGSRVSKNTVWDYFAAVVQYGEFTQPIKISLRDVAADSREQIYNVGPKKEDAATHDSLQEDLSNYGASTSSEDNISEPTAEVKQKYQQWDEETQNNINTSMTMDQAKTMIQKAFKYADPNAWKDEGETRYRNGDEWLKDVGASYVAMYIENEYELQDKYVNSNEHIINDEFTIEDVVQAYLDGTLIGKAKPNPERLDTSRETGFNDTRFYAPKNISVSKETMDLASSKATAKNKAEVNEARKNILLAAHNRNLSEELGITQSELNKKLRSWSRYPASARETSMRINAGVAPENQWTGIQNTSILSQINMTDEDIRSMVKEITGTSSEYQRNYIGRTMLALDTHINWSNLTFEFLGGNVDPNRSSVRGRYRNENKTIYIGRGSGENTVAHEMGHALDYQWEIDLFGKSYGESLTSNKLRNDLIKTDEGRQFYKNFRIFMDSLTDVGSNYNSYTMDPGETFARFVAKFVEWTRQTAGEPVYREYLSYDDRFTTSQYIEFARLLQEKAMIDSAEASGTYISNPDIRYQEWETGEADTASESRGRAEAYTNIKAESKVVRDLINDLNKEVKTLTKQNSKLARELKRNVTPEVRATDANRIAGQLLDEYMSKADKKEVAAGIKQIGDYLVQHTGEDLDYNTVQSMAREIAENVISWSEQKLDVDPIFETVANDLKGAVIQPPAAQDLGEFNIVDGFSAFKRSLGKKLVFNKDGVPIDTMYEELRNTYPGVFPDVNNPSEMLMAMADIFDRAKPQMVNPFEKNMGEMTETLTNDIVFYSLSEELRQMAPTKMEKAQAKYDALKTKDAAKIQDVLQKQRARYEALRERKNARIEQVRKEGLARKEEALAREKAEKWDKVQGLKDYYRNKEREAHARRKESAGFQKYRKQVMEKSSVLSDMLLKNSDEEHVPEVLKGPLSEFLTSINFDSKRKLAGGEDTKADIKLRDRAAKLLQIFDNQQNFIDGKSGATMSFDGYLDIPEQSRELLRKMVNDAAEIANNNGTYTINSMSADDLKALSETLSAITSAIKHINSFMANERFSSVREAAAEDIRYMEKMGRVRDSDTKGLSTFLKWKDATPYFAMKRFGEGGKSIFSGLTKGWERFAFNAKEIIDFADNLYTTKEVNEWKNDIHDITLSNGDQIRMTTAQIMEFSQLLNREQARKHMDHGGIRIGNITKKGATITDVNHYHFSAEDINNILGLLTDRQMQVATEMRKYMGRRGGEWGNEVSMRRHGYNFYTEGENYYTIRTDSNVRPMDDTDAQQNSMFRLLNLSSSKSLNPNANNALIVGDIFDTFADHMADMAKLNALGLPILDAIKWFNYSDRQDIGGEQFTTKTMQGIIEQTYGQEAQRYFRTLIKDINGIRESGDRGTDLSSKLMTNFKIASVGANMRVAMLQPTAYVRASYILDPEYMIKAFKRKNGYEEAMQYSGTANWKALGFYDTNISRGIRQQIEHDDSWRDKISDASMKLAEKGDQRTWGRIWTACKLQTMAQDPSLTSKTKYEELMSKTADLFREVIYSSQVMDSTLTRSELMRGSTMATKAATSFMAEPTVNYNILLDAYSEYDNARRVNGKAEAWKQTNGKFAKAFAVYAASAISGAVVESLADAIRDDDDYEKFWQKYLQALFGEGKGKDKLLSSNVIMDLGVVGKLPYFKDLVSVIQGYDVSNMATDGLTNSYESIKGLFSSSSKTTVWGKIYKAMQAASQVVGIPGSGLARDTTALFNSAVTIWNDTIGSNTPSMKIDFKIKTYDAGPKSSIKAAYNNGFLSDDEAQKALVDEGLSKTTADARKEVFKWENGSSSLYAPIKEAIFADDSDGYYEQRRQLYNLGVTANDLRSEIKSAVKERYLAGELNRTESEKILKKYALMPSTDMAYTFYKWDLGDEALTESKFNNYNQYVRSTGISIEDFGTIFDEADTDKNGSVKQDELGSYLQSLVDAGVYTERQANALFKVNWHAATSKTYTDWVNG